MDEVVRIVAALNQESEGENLVFAGNGSVYGVLSQME